MNNELLNNQKSDFVAYDYMNIEVKSKYAPLYRDCYENFGWLPVADFTNGKAVTLQLKRNKDIKNKTKISELQKKCDDSLIAIDQYENKKSLLASVLSYLLGLEGIVFVALSVFYYIGYLGPGGITMKFLGFAVAGIPCCFTSYTLWKKVSQIQSKKSAKKAEEEYEFVNNLCREANALLE